MTPAPTTTSRSGTLSSSSAPVEDTIRFSSMATPGSGVTSEPVAITIAFVSSTCCLPSSALTSTSPGATMRPAPMNASILFFLSRKATPWTLAVTVSFLCFIMPGRSSFGVPTPMPNAPN
jgi:hypothetical protein